MIVVTVGIAAALVFAVAAAPGGGDIDASDGFCVT